MAAARGRSCPISKVTTPVPVEGGVAGGALGDRLRHEMLLAYRPEQPAVGDAAVGASIEVKQAEIPADAEDQPAAIHGDALEPPLVAPGRAEPCARRSQDLSGLHSASG
jgi:hypothetical protein